MIDKVDTKLTNRGMNRAAVKTVFAGAVWAAMAVVRS